MSSQSWQDWLAKQRADSQMTVKEVGLDKLLPVWAMRVIEGLLRFCAFLKEKLSFFCLAGFHVSDPSREVSEWDQALLMEIGEPGAVVLVRQGTESMEWVYLVAARAEPGNPQQGCVILGPVLQASWSNLRQDHGGRRPPRAELFDGRLQPISWVPMTQDGGRFRGKVVHYGVVSFGAREEIKLNPNERWFTRKELREAAFAGEVNAHLAQAFFLELI